MDLSRFGSASYTPFLRDVLKRKYENKKIDVAVGVMSPSLNFLLAFGAEIFPGTPIIFCGVDKRQLGDRVLPPHVRGVLLKREFERTLGLALHLHRATEKVVVVSGSSEFDTGLLAEARAQFRSYDNRVAFSYLEGLRLPQLLDEVEKRPPGRLFYLSHSSATPPTLPTSPTMSSTKSPGDQACLSTALSISTLAGALSAESCIVLRRTAAKRHC
jgi:two-component system cell cycle sensor histidine kinase/response regulator CckA